MRFVYVVIFIKWCGLMQFGERHPSFLPACFAGIRRAMQASWLGALAICRNGSAFGFINATDSTQSRTRLR
jgi:hypothetical protein